MYFYRKIIKECTGISEIAEDMLLFEIGYDQGEAVSVGCVREKLDLKMM